MNKIKIQRREKTITKAIPASKLDIIIYLLTFGRKGKTFSYVKENVTEYSVPTSYNCRCTMRELK